ncbi:GIY-YIG nuclease family protein [Marivita sp. S6314]|uniref:GIY-YIG nuclease family protein n=1 Tax=Marivita sp. S6314 TaxID=2926406 RepID=UPI001FF4427B|nr:GIY-YIG nuclease family protein [Marivita sp. S6314]MCK0148687.1 GIY-YIG nuclease family protein [Marivita sp. S6314]
MDAKAFRSAALQQLTNDVGVYALCDLDCVPIYVGQSVDGIRARVRRHLTSARSDIIANRQIDVWEIGFVLAWPVEEVTQIPDLEAFLFTRYDAQSRLMNGKTLPVKKELPFAEPVHQSVQIVDDAELQIRRDPANRLPRQIAQYLRLVDYIQTVKDAPHLKRSLDAHFERLIKYHRSFL